MRCVCFFFKDTATTEIYTLSLPDASSDLSVFVVESDGSIGYAWVADNPGQEPDYEAVMAHCASP